MNNDIEINNRLSNNTLQAINTCCKRPDIKFHLTFADRNIQFPDLHLFAVGIKKIINALSSAKSETIFKIK